MYSELTLRLAIQFSLVLLANRRYQPNISEMKQAYVARVHGMREGFRAPKVVPRLHGTHIVTNEKKYRDVL